MPKVKVDKELQWIIPYLNLAQRLVPLKRLDRVVVKRATLDEYRKQDEHASCVKYGSRYEIILWLKYSKFTHTNGRKCEMKLKRYSRIDILTHLAHELAHVAAWNECHNAKHKLIESKLLVIFMKYLDKDTR